MTTFSELGLRPELLEALTQMGFTTPTPIQEQTIPLLTENITDLVALAQTGTGKTAAFGLPLLNIMDEERRTPQALILCPTRELCMQITKDLEAFSSKMPFVKIVAPAVAAKGLPVIAIQFLPCNGGFCVCCPTLLKEIKI